MRNLQTWIRKIKIELFSEKTKRKIVFNDSNLNINISGTKKLASNLDEFLIVINNLDAKQNLELSLYEYNLVKIYCSYSDRDPLLLFDGSILQISEKKDSRETSSTYIVCGSKFLAKSRKSLTYNFKQGTRLKTILEYIARRERIKLNVDNSYNYKVLQQNESMSGTSGALIDNIIKKNPTGMINCDATSTYHFNIIDNRNYIKREIEINPKSGTLINGFARLTNEGINFDSLLVVNFSPGDVIKIASKYIQFSVESYEDVKNSYKTQAQLNFNEKDKNVNKYVIFQLNYLISNKGGEFKVSVLAKNYNLYQNSHLLNRR